MALKTGDAISDDFIAEKIKERVEQIDCQINGYVLDGFPSNPNQLNLMKEMEIVPSHIILLELSDHAVYERIENRRFDPLDGQYYSSTN